MSSLEVVAAYSPAVPAWVSIVVVIVGTLLGSGGFAAIVKVRYDRRAGVEAHEVIEDDAVVARWAAIATAQVEVLINPLRVRMTELEATVARLDRELTESQRRYWSGVGYIRVILRLLHRHVPDAEIPPPPANIAEDI